MLRPLEKLFPKLAMGDYAATSPPDSDYNCIAWAAGDNQRWWWPARDPGREYWPAGVPCARTRAAFVAAFATLGYVICDSEAPEAEYEKIALFADAADTPTHAARQLAQGRWSSKLGKAEDIEHALHDLEGVVYGSVVLVMKRPVSAGS